MGFMKFQWHIDTNGVLVHTLQSLNGDPWTKWPASNVILIEFSILLVMFDYKGYVASIIWTESYWYFCRWCWLANQSDHIRPHLIAFDDPCWKPFVPQIHIFKTMLLSLTLYKLQIVPSWLVRFNLSAFCFNCLIVRDLSLNILHCTAILSASAISQLAFNVAAYLFVEVYPPAMVGSSPVFLMFPHSLDAEILQRSQISGFLPGSRAFT